MAQVVYTAPGLTIANVESAVALAMGWSTSDATELGKIDQAITEAGLATCGWQGRTWWWQRATGWFNTLAEADIVTTADSGASRSSNVVTITTTAAHGLTVSDMVKVHGVAASSFDGIWTVATVPTTTTFTYAQTGSNATSQSGTVNAVAFPLRTVNSSLMTDAWSIESVYYSDDWRLKNIGKPTWDRDYTLTTSTTSTKPFGYAIFGEAPYIGLWPAPDAAYTIYIKYVKRHSKITSAGSTDAALIIPAEYHWGIYVGGATWILRHEQTEAMSLQQCPAFMEAIGRMAMSDPALYDEYRNADMFPDAVGSLPNDRYVIQDESGTLIMNDVSL